MSSSKQMPLLLIVLILLCLFQVYPLPLSNARENPNSAELDKDQVVIDFNNVDITVFLKFISELTGKNFVVDSKVRGNVTIISPAKISTREAYRVF